MKKNEDKAGEEKRIISELWNKTEKDGNEHGILIGGTNVLELDGGADEISDESWTKAKWLLLDNPKIVFVFYHTHPDWDCPLSGDDVAVFLRFKNLQSMMAITEERTYTITKTKQSVHIDYKNWDELVESHKIYTLSKLHQIIVIEAHNHSIENYREALWMATKRLAHEYNFLCKEKKL